MLTEERFNLILQLLQKKGAVTVTELTKALRTSESTVRRDLNCLDEMGKLKKVHGGATLLGDEFMVQEEDMETKSAKFLPEKLEIGRYAATLIQDSDFVYIDAGSTTEKMVDCIEKSKAIFITNGISHVRKLTQKGCEAYILGGKLKLVTEAIIGSEALQNISRYNFSKCFLGTNGIHKTKGITTPDMEEAVLKRDAISRSITNFVLADHSKFDLVSAVRFAETGSTCIITDKLSDASYHDITIVKEVSK